jgi:hypothetical protein
VLGGFLSDVSQPAHITRAESHPKTPTPQHNEARTCQQGPENGVCGGSSRNSSSGRIGGEFPAFWGNKRERNEPSQSSSSLAVEPAVGTFGALSAARIPALQIHSLTDAKFGMRFALYPCC